MANVIQNIKSDTEYNFVVVGSGLTGLLIAKNLSKFNESVLLVEALDVAGGSNKKISAKINGEEICVFNNGLRWLPHHASSDRLLDFLGASLDCKLEDIVDESSLNEDPILTYDHSQLKPFLGFKDNAPEFYEELSYFLHPKSYLLRQQPYAWVEKLLESYTGDLLLKSYVTRFNPSADNKENIESLTINGNKTIKAKHFVFTGSVKDLSVLVPEEILGHKGKSKLNKNTYWQTVCLDLVHSHVVTEKNNLFLLNGTTQDEVGPCVGAFSGAYSQWMTFIDQENAEETENIALALKKIKRQIKRAFPESLDNLVSERIFISPAIGGDGNLKLNSNQTLHKTENLWIASPAMSLQKNLYGALAQAQLILSSLGYHIDIGFADSENLRENFAGEATAEEPHSL